jgi:uncharacterized membrane protein YjjP (DUF1212 family)
MDAQLPAFVLELGRALSLAGGAVGEIQRRLARVAAVNGAPDVRVVALPTVLMIAFGPDGATTTEPVPHLTGRLRLDQIARLYDLLARAERGEVAPAEGRRRLAAIWTMTPRYGRTVTVLGYTVMTAGLCLILRPTPVDVAVAAGLGALVALLGLIVAGRPTPRVLVPVAAATLVSALTFAAVDHGLLEPGLRTLIPPLVTFLPGAALTTATVELASGEMVAGASRLVFGALQLTLLSFGVVAGADLVGLPRAEALDDNYANVLGWWAPWLGVVLYGLAVTVHFSAPPGVLRWLLVVLLAAWVGQQAGRLVAGPAVSGFLGALVMTPVALAVARRPGGPPAQVTFLPAFWLLVPGSVGLIGLTEAVGDPSLGLASLVQPLASIIAISLGVLCGASVHRVLAGRPWRRRRLARGA